MIINRDDFMACARVVSIINPIAGSAEDICRKMISLAHQLTAPGYIGTGGFYITTYYPAWDKENLHTHPTVMPYCVQKYIDGRGE